MWVAVRMVRLVVMVVVVLVLVLVPLMPGRQQQRGHDVDDQPQDGDRDRFVKVDRRRRHQPDDRFEPHVTRDADKAHGARIAAEHFDLPGSEGESRVGPGVGQAALADTPSASA
jgi:hypothetical protein